MVNESLINPLVTLSRITYTIREDCQPEFNCTTTTTTTTTTTLRKLKFYVYLHGRRKLYLAPWGEWGEWSACPDVNVECAASRFKTRNCSAGNDDFGQPYCGTLTEATLEEQCPDSDCGKVPKIKNYLNSFLILSDETLCHCMTNDMFARIGLFS